MKKSKRVPRYTSYPIYPRWNNQLNDNDLIDQIKLIDRTELYIHIPFCTKPCFYCGCNKIVARQGTQDDKYTDMLIKEWGLYKKINPDMNVESIHFGGGTPTFLCEKNISKVLGALNLNKDCKISIEVDPRVTTKEQLEIFKNFGANRISMGIQDFAPEVQKIINRIQPPKMVEEITETIRGLGIDDINFDLIYGLPKQSIETINKTLEHVMAIKPQTISLFSYAHIPEQFPLQKRLTDYLPSESDKESFYKHYKQKLVEMGYSQIGLDHFALEESFLFKSYQLKQMRRSFMGYVYQKLDNQIGLGVSAISDLKGCFYQNEKTIDDYYSRLDKNELPYSYSHAKSAEDIIVSNIIERLMCYKQADFRELISDFSPSKALDFLSQLKGMGEQDKTFSFNNGCISLNGDELSLREVCFNIDNLLRKMSA